MNNFVKRLAVFASATFILTTDILAEESSQSSSNLAGFVSVGAGNFIIAFPDVGPAGQAVGEDIGWGDVYGEKGGIAINGEGGLGIANMGLFGVLKYRRWEKSGSPALIGSGSFDGRLTWTQEFLSLGGRYFFVSQTKSKSSILPFIGGGFIRSEAGEKMLGTFSIFGSDVDIDLVSNLDGNGFYVEGGADLFISPSISLKGIIEYSKLNLGTSISGTRYEIDGGGGTYAAVGVNFLFGKPLK